LYSKPCEILDFPKILFQCILHIENNKIDIIRSTKGEKMKLSRPKDVTWWIAVLLGVLGLLGFVGTVPGLAPYAFWLVFAGLVLLALGTLLRNL